MFATLTLVVCAAATAFEPLDGAAIKAFSAQPAAVETHGPLQRLAMFGAAVRAADPTAALKLFDALGASPDPLAMAARFHATRLRVAQGMEFIEDQKVLLGTGPADRPMVRWGIRRSEQAALLTAIAARREAQSNIERARELRILAAMRFPRHAQLPEQVSRQQRKDYAEALIRDMDYEGGVEVLSSLVGESSAQERNSLNRRIIQVRADLMRTDYAEIAALVRGTISRTKPARPDDVMMLAYAAGKVDPREAVRAYRTYLEQFPAGPAREEAAFFIAWTDFDGERFDAAVKGFDEFLAAYPKGVYRNAARWYRGLCAYRLDRLDAALDDFIYTKNNGRERNKGAYWTARILADKGEIKASRAGYRRLAMQAPFDYYGILARARLGEAFQAPEYRRSKVLRAPESHGRLAQRLAAVPTHVRDQLTEALAIAQVGHLGLATRLLRFLVQAYPTELHDGPLLAELQRRCGDFAALVRGSQAKRCRAALGSDPENPTVKACWNLHYPRAYEHFMGEMRTPVPTALVWAIMRQESFYQPDARSVADALGLMQLIPQVAGPAAKLPDEDYEPYEATRPMTNLRWFAAGTRARYEHFGGHVPLFLMSYNATPESAAGWLRENRDLPFDLFVEEISFKETRDYVKRISGHLARYNVLLGADGSLHERAGLPHPDRVAGDAFAAALPAKRP